MAEIVAIRQGAAEGPVIAHLEVGILRVTLASPPANALSLALMAALQAEIDRARDDPAIRVVIIAANGKVFSAGHDLKEITAHRSDADRGRAFFEQTMAACATLMQAIVRCPKPVIAEVDGVATAAGCQLVASCDLAIATDQASFATPGVNIGLFCSTPMVALSRNVSRKQAMEMLLTGEKIDAATARDFGLVNRVVPREYLHHVVNKYAQTIASKSPLTLKIGKEAFYAQAEMGLAEAYDYAARAMVENMMARDAEEGIGAFIAKREPKWTGE
jgi:enoyl-CoA hydratase/carnithine racemase